MTLLEIYTMTLPVVATENLLMGVTLLSIFGKNPTQIPHYRIGIRFMAIAMLMMACINYLEIFLNLNSSTSAASLAMVLPAAAIQLFLMLYAYIALMDSSYITRRKIEIEVLLIVLFTFPPLFIDAESRPSLFYPLLYLGLGYYIVKYIFNFGIYRRCYQHTQTKLQNYYGKGDARLLNWLHYTFYTALMVGGISIVVPLTNYLTLILYQCILFLSYFYMYWEILRHELIIHSLSLIIHQTHKQEADAPEHVEDKVTAEATQTWDVLFDKWIGERHYATPGITIEDVARQLKTNRTTLSLYLNSELKLNFYEWISRIRIKIATKLLIENPTLPIIEVASHVGIEDRSNFDKLFKRIVGLSPATYRIEEAKKKIEVEMVDNERG